MMAVQVKVKELLDGRGINITHFAKLANISYPTALAWYHGTTRRIELETLASVLDGLGVELQDILIHTKDESKATAKH